MMVTDAYMPFKSLCPFLQDSAGSSLRTRGLCHCLLFLGGSRWHEERRVGAHSFRLRRCGPSSHCYCPKHGLPGLHYCRYVEQRPLLPATRDHSSCFQKCFCPCFVLICYCFSAQKAEEKPSICVQGQFFTMEALNKKNYLHVKCGRAWKSYFLRTTACIIPPNQSVQELHLLDSLGVVLQKYK